MSRNSESDLQQNTSRQLRSTTSQVERKVSDLDFADDIALLENDPKRSGQLKIQLRTRIFNAACIPVLLYGCESWTLTETSTEKLDVFVRTLLRIIYGVKQSETHMTNDELYKQLKQRNTKKAN